MRWRILLASSASANLQTALPAIAKHALRYPQCTSLRAPAFTSTVRTSWCWHGQHDSTADIVVPVQCAALKR